MLEARFARPHCFPSSSLRFLPSSPSCSVVLPCSIAEECTVCVCLYEPSHVDVCVPGSTKVHVCALRQCGALWFPGPHDYWLSSSSSHSSYYIPSPISDYCPPLPCHHPSFVDSVQKVWLNTIPGRAVSGSNLEVQYKRGKPMLVLNTSEKKVLKVHFFPKFNLSLLLCFYYSPPSFFLPSFTLCSSYFIRSCQHFFSSRHLRICNAFWFLFQRLASAKAHTSRFVSANLPCNKFKNRLVNIMPYETTRVCLQPIRGVEGSDYINASFIDGYRSGKKKKFYSCCWLSVGIR